ncbi:cytochrome P450 CYP72A616-like [Primulina tabacum]|uniref:cytochrome P450 CYP72A616-like n=1 Tax=Primulina tabacum TaxID=48773 RepID=UPI003F595C7B
MEGGFIVGYFRVISSAVLILILCIIGVVYYIWWKPKKLEKYLRRAGIEGSSYKLMYGDMVEIKKLTAEAWSKPMPLNHSIAPRVNPFWYQMVQKYGKISLSWHERSPQLLVADPGLVKSIFTERDGHFRKPPLNPLVDLLTLGLSTLEGDQWAKRRKLITPAFHLEKIQGMVPAFLTSCCNLVERWNKVSVDSEGKFELDIAPEMQNLSSDVIARAAFGSSFEEAKTIFELQKEQAVLVLEAFQSLYFPGLRFLPTKKNRRRYEIDRKIKTTLKEMILSKETKAKNGNPDDDLLSLLIQYQKQSDNEMTIDDIMEECKLFYFAGQETTATWLTWTMIVLCMHPNWQEKAREEVIQVFGKRTPDVKALNQLKIVSMILQEVLRLYTPVPTQSRYTLKKTRLGDMEIPAGVKLILPLMLLHHDPEYWGEDVKEFKPERFSGGVSKAAKDDQVAFFPFGWGPRFCLGQNFAMVEAKLALSMILQNFLFELSPSYTHAPHTVITLQPQYGAPLILHRI